MTISDSDGQRMVTIESLPGSVQAVGGTIGISEEVVATIAGVAARAVPGVHALGRWRFVPFMDRPRHGVAAEVGSEEAALNLEVVVDYGTDIRELAETLRTGVAAAIDQMAGRRVVEVNIKVVGIARPPEPEQAPPPGRVK